VVERHHRSRETLTGAVLQLGAAFGIMTLGMLSSFSLYFLGVAKFDFRESFCKLPPKLITSTCKRSFIYRFLVDIPRSMT